ncbi:MAG TPA: 16S rRNA (guanine(527)-N(7))-methyltransferase RsmG [Acidiferrobacteraceae bacterium]|nr:16S rRNA (guanine(527)-N(7))-methyltransferase RsmG [Acidiferrobacteraceae bacterium]
MTSAKQLKQGLLELGQALPTDTQANLLAYLDLLQAWNRASNLTAVRDREAMVTRHLLDSLSITPYIRGPRVLDFGSGAGLPGLPLAMALPDTGFVLLDSNKKKIRFLRHVVATLSLANVEVVESRLEQYQPTRNFDTLTSRAFSDLTTMLHQSRHLFAAGAQLLAMKGKAPREEIAGLPAAYLLEQVVSLDVPGLDAARHLLIITPSEAR